MKLIIMLMSLFIVSCSFKSSKNDNKSIRSINELKPSDLKKIDSDGDLISDYEEKERGLDPLVANFPKLSVNFLQDYSIKVLFEDESEFLIDTKVARDNPDFKYRIGELFLRENSQDNAAKFGRFSGVSTGEIKQQDYTWVKYPDIDKDYYFSKTREYKYWSKNKVKESSINLENTLKLMESPLFDTIEEVELNFYYYSYSKEAYVQLHTEKLDRNFQSGIREDFQITISNPPLELIEDTYFRHGEFIISEVKDFYIPSLKLKYSDLMNSIKAKTIPIYKTTPFENDLNYVAISKNGEKFISIMTKLFSDKFSVQEDKLVQVEQFLNNLSDYDYLHQVSKEDKAGKWFVMTNKIKDQYLKHNFTKNDSITISYLTGSDLSKRTNEKIYSFSEEIKSNEDGVIYPLGNITYNSSLTVSLFFKRLEGKRLDVKYQNFYYKPNCRRNCTGANWWVSADYQINSFQEFSKKWEFNDYASVAESFEVLINNTVLNLDELIESNHASIKLSESSFGKYLHLSLNNIHELEIIESGKENVVYLRLKPIDTGFAGEGIQINSVSGKNINKVEHASMINFQQAFQRKKKIAVTSWKFDEWQIKIPWGEPDRRTGWKPTKGNKKKYWTGTVIDLISTVTINYN